MKQEARLRWSLAALRLSVFVVMAAWTVDKVVRPDHAAKIFEGFYGLGGLGETVLRSLAVAEVLLLVLFLLGAAKTLTYGTVLLLHGVSTLASYHQYLAPFEGPNLLFFAAWPMLAACLALFLLRDEDTLATVGSRRARR